MRVSTHDGTPLTGTGVDTDTDTLSLGLIDHGLKEVDVVGLGGGPVRRALNIEPEHTVLDTTGGVVGGIDDFVLGLVENGMGGKVTDGVIDLLGWVTARVAWEDVTINVGKTSVPGVVNVGWTVGIWGTCGLVDTDNGEGIAITSGARPGRRRGQLRDINTGSGEGSSNDGEKDNEV